MCNNFNKNKDEKFDNAWKFYQHADSINATRFNFFMVAESMFILAYSSVKDNPDWLKLLLIISGLIITILWLVITNNIQEKMDKLNEKYLKKDMIYGYYLGNLDCNGIEIDNNCNKKTSSKNYFKFIQIVLIFFWVIILLCWIINLILKIKINF